MPFKAKKPRQFWRFWKNKDDMAVDDFNKGYSYASANLVVGISASYLKNTIMKTDFFKTCPAFLQGMESAIEDFKRRFGQNDKNCM